MAGGAELNQAVEQQLCDSVQNNVKIVQDDDDDDDPQLPNNNNDDDSLLQITSFTDIVDQVTLHFQIIRMQKQIYAWIGCNSTKFGRMYAAAPTRPNNTVSVTSILGGTSDNTGSGIARRLVLKTGLSVLLACNIPKNNPMLEVNAEKKLMERLIGLGYTKPNSKSGSSS
ncbi:hypothetical protein ACFE04_007381 [Oxalis oulophora]